ncbi:c-type cytochrome [Azospirillum doebereinerae]|uniref:cytochrome-c oxidase n=1 Tax=Azospirillum doebereinerae TaxID=92933 RepID=A0A433J4I5_9PROT|nr:c-type cytochrome [Azospirillum doebereinerae]RUQ67120.1 c-type cytochrome [Azospirillum doebereinerae]
MSIPLWPRAASFYADRIDLLVVSFSALLLCLAVPVFVAILWFAVKYRRGSPAERGGPVKREAGIEAAWMAIPFLLSLGFWFWAAELFFVRSTPPPGTLDITVVGKQWMWKAQHPGGQSEIDTLHVPAGQPVRLRMTSQDVIHSLFLPELRLKQDVLPGRTTELWFQADRPGTYALRCTQFCGTDHATMGGELVVLPPTGYADWLSTSAVEPTLAQEGAALFRRLGCSGCHGSSGGGGAGGGGGSAVRAPDLGGIYRLPQPLADGGTVIADERYLRDSILDPVAQVVAGYEPVMPSFAGKLEEADLMRLVAYIASLKPPSGTTP